MRKANGKAAMTMNFVGTHKNFLHQHNKDFKEKTASASSRSHDGKCHSHLVNSHLAPPGGGGTPIYKISTDRYIPLAVSLE